MPLRGDGRHLPEHVPTETVDVTVSRDAKQLMALRAALAALVAGLGALAAAATGDTITLHGWLTAAAAAAAAAGAVFGVKPTGGQARTEIPTRDLEALQDEQRMRGPQR